MTLAIPEYSNPLCLVCGNDGNGVHFGVQTCRACAMFFRRSHTQQTLFQCKNHSKFCNIRVAEHRLMCKYCRLKKCQEAGMSSEKKDPSKSRCEIATVPQTTTIAQMIPMSDPKRVMYDVIDPVTNKSIRWIDIGPIIRRSKEILEDFHPPTTTQFKSLNALQKMTFSLQKLQSGQKKQPKMMYEMTFDDYLLHWEELMTRAAEWLMHSEQFYGLPEHERLNFFKIIWAVWRRVERNSLTAKIFGQRCLDEKLLLISDDMVMQFDNFEVDMTEISGKSMAEYRRFMRKHLLLYFDIVVRPCLEWNFTDTELNFALSQIVWNYASRKLLGQTLQASDAFLAEISENLHEYYRNEMRLKNYAPRLAVLMEMVNGVLKVQAEHERTLEMGFLFDMVNVVVSEPAFFSV
ncbi:hypothetical protein CRE_23543 [Caenorhabditis remanei]|uniref:Uncharacterized protein n=1 Tax=Caenorhabditis remanei TaxID=31234 RepID=E3MHA3_CAERE|nr:hypothetical protein CRE_23543 [Caenorhabditis remanei]